MISGLITIAGGILAASSFIILKKPDAKQWIDKLAPYQGWIGIVMFFWGINETLGVIRSMGYISLDWVFWLIIALADLLVGFLLGFALISKYALSKNEAAMKKGEEIRMKITKFQIPLGFVAIVAGILYIVMIYT